MGGPAAENSAAAAPPGAAISAKAARGGIQSLERAAAILDVIARSPDGIGLSEISQKVGLHSSTAFHLLKTLVHIGYVVQSNESKRYRVGARIFGLAAGALDDNTLLVLGAPVLERLSAETGEAAHLAIRSQTDILMVARTAAPGLLQLADRPGAVRPAHATAIGKMLLASMPVEPCRALVHTLALERYTRNTITEAETLLNEIEDIRASGMAHDRCEFDGDVRCIAVPVRDFAGRSIAAMGISGPVWRMGEDALPGKAVVLEAAAAELSALLGFAGVVG
ncbi:IclR family transcriptional regulator [Solirhodobacter olei]|uniref:IclR family transcriptional regulator n=1 Tax=Solirhodobacter olei TaxID=2493082 RepID=UPI000FD96472|nr:IclR family transcriptional regulator [Solirhodobacter olei]